MNEKKIFSPLVSPNAKTFPASSSSTASMSNNETLSTKKTPPKDYTISVSDPDKLSIKISKIKQPAEIEQAKTIKTNKFYSSSTNTTTNNNTPSVQSSGSTTKKTAESKSNNQSNKNSSLSTWQANLASQLALPEDFTPELISQLAAEGYDVVSATGRKSRAKVAQTQAQHQQRMIDLSDDEDDKDDNRRNADKGYQPSNSRVSAKSSKANNNSETTKAPQQTMKFNNNYRAQTSSELMKYDDPTEHPSYKRFTQMLDDLLDTYEQDLQQMSLNSRRNGEDKGGGGDEIPSEYLLPKQTCHELVQEAFKLNAYSIIHLIRKESLFKLQNLLFFNIKDGIRSLHLMNEVFIFYH